MDWRGALAVVQPHLHQIWTTVQMVRPLASMVLALRKKKPQAILVEDYARSEVSVLWGLYCRKTEHDRRYRLTRQH